jgi:hypothetical protein
MVLFWSLHRFSREAVLEVVRHLDARLKSWNRIIEWLRRVGTFAGFVQIGAE